MSKVTQHCSKARRKVLLGVLVSVFSLAFVACSHGQSKSAKSNADAVKLGPYGPPMGMRARVVRSVRVTTSGAVAGTFTGSKADDVTGLMGLCDPNSFANFMLALPGGKQYDEVWVTNMSTRAVGTGATGTFRLDYIDLTFRKTTGAFVQREFRGPGTMTLTTHSAAPGNRRMIGTMEGTGLKGMGKDAGKTLNVKVSFDMNSSCGVTP
jgi:hypothetical protein